MNTRALILFGHGARDARWAAPFKRLQQIVQQQLPDVTVTLAFLELMPPQLPELVEQLEEGGHTEATIVPVFFGQGGHVLRDLPLIIEKLRQDHAEMTIKVAGAVGEDADVLNAVATYCVASLARQ
ncbi:cobalamin biosynthesis protein CbiX [Noviherbaspirillum cavernae]|uniref:Cobalamin biosynthesis protein CbiX n=1 Tax=Noviherbaspirillum cavernae TaxID=2320862 RepID=A0A418WZT4_9BURK|nr:CbiX/SirB N-terminal domain-containing protein [Noviherbaspirillum cavernae]RJG05603.1 cobalamin biosynthesis protein CbiX [Noviherbaspirillum cavernae]